jgi:hypothetical protein
MALTSALHLNTSSAGREIRLERLDRLSRLFDVAFAVPGANFRFGVEGGAPTSTWIWRRRGVSFVVLACL